MSEMALELIRRAKKEGWKRLDLGRTGIVGAVPEEVGDLDGLEELVLSEEWWDWDGIRWVKKKTENRGPANKITAFPARPPLKLRKLVCYGTQVQDLAPLSNLTQLQTLNCYNTKVQDLAALSNLTQLQSLYCSYTQVKDLAPLSNLTQLHTLDCSKTQVKDLAPLSNLTQLQELYCSQTQVKDLSPLSNLTLLQTLHCSYTQVQDLAPLSKLTQLHTLYCSRTQVKDLAPLSKLTQLQTLDCSETEVQDLAPLSNLTQLQTLWCSNTQVKDLAPVGNLTQLHRLDCSGTQVKDLAPLSNLTQLQELHCSSTQVQDLAPLSNLTQLQTLLCFHTQVKDLAPVKAMIERGIEVKWDTWDGRPGIFVQDCPLTNPPVEIAQQGNAAILAYWAEQERKQTIPATEIKLFLLGNTTAGKSTLRDGLCTGEWVEQKSTHGAALNKTWEITEKGIKINLWDFGGQEYYHSTHSLYLGANSLYAVVIDPARNQPGEWPTLISYFGETEPKEELLEHFPQSYWLEMLAQHQPQGTVFLIWNKLDKPSLPPFRATDNDHQVVSPATLEDYKISLQAALRDKDDHWLSKWIAIKNDLAQSAQKVLQGQEWITYWPVIKADLEQESRTRIEMPLAELRSRSAWWANRDPDKPYEATAPPAKMDDAVFGNILTYLRDMTGSILYWPNGPLQDRVFINPHKINELIYAVLTRQVKDQGGRFTRAHAAEQIPKGLDAVYGIGNWTEDPEELADTLLLIMKQFGIVFEVAEDSEDYVAPQYLGKEEPEGVKANLEDYFEVSQTIDLLFGSYIPRHIIPQFIARMGQLAAERKYWKYGILLREKGRFGLVKALYDQNTIRLQIEKGEGDTALTRMIFEGLKSIWGENQHFQIQLQSGVGVSLQELQMPRSTHNRICRDAKGKEVDVREFLPFLPEEEFRRYYKPLENKTMKEKRHIHICYAETPKDKPFLDSLVQNLRALEGTWEFSYWSRDQMKLGPVKLSQIQESISKADVFIFLMSIDLISSEDKDTKYDYAEATKQALERDCLVIPIKIRSFFGFENQPIGKYPTPPGVEVLNLEKDIDQAWEKVITRIAEVFEQVNEYRSRSGENPSILQIVSGLDKKVNLLMEDSQMHTQQNEVIIRKINNSYSHLMHKLQSMSEFGNEAYQNLMMLGEKTYWSVEALQDQFEDQNTQLEAALQSVIERIREHSPETAQKLNAELAPAAELSKSRKFLQSIKLKLPVIAIATALVTTGGAAGVGIGLATALAGAIEWETNADVAFQKVIGFVKSLDKPLPENWQPTNWD